MSLLTKSILLLSMLVGGVSSALADYVVKGMVVDQSMLPEAYATVRVFALKDTIRPVATGITDDAGAFLQRLSVAGNYRLTINSVGKSPIKAEFKVDSSHATVDLGTLTIRESDASLQEIEVVAMRPLVSKEIDRLGYDVQADDDSKTSTVQEILRKVPLVTVDADGTVKVRGQSNFKIYKNGRPSNQLTGNAKDILASIPAAMIKKIEVITEPGAKEDAEGVGAIINIVTVENSSINGMMGSVRVSESTMSTKPSGSVWLTGNIGKFAMSANVGYFSQSKAKSRQKSESRYTYVNTGNTVETHSANSGKADVLSYMMDASYELDSLNLFTMEFGGYNYGLKYTNNSHQASYAPDQSLIYSFAQSSFIPRQKYFDINGNFNYQHLTHRRGESVTLSYAISTNKSNTDTQTEYDECINFPVSYSGINSSSVLNFIEHTAQVDWTRPLNDHHTLAVGGKFIQRNNHSLDDREYVGVGETHRDFVHRTSIGAAYFDYRLQYGAWSGRAGMRYEFSHLAAQFKDGSDEDFSSNLSDWVPNASVMYQLNAESSLKLTYQTRINRPGISWLNPAVEESPTSISFGNPDLKSIRRDNFALNYSLYKPKLSIDFSVDYSQSNNDIVSMVSANENDVTISTYGNTGRERDVVFSAYVNWRPTLKTSLMVNARCAYQDIRTPSLGLSNNRWGVGVFGSITQKLPWKLRAEGMIAYSTGDLYSLYSYSDATLRGMFHQISLQRSFLKDDRLTVKAYARMPFICPMEMRTSYNRGDYTGYSVNRMEKVRQFGLEVSLRFGSVKAQVKKVAKTISNDDLQGGSSAPAASGM
jgi:hypothetical protein